MIALATTFYDIVLFFHILAVVLAFGPTFAYPVFVMMAERHGGRALPSVGEAIGFWDTRVLNPGLIVILATGLYLALDRWELSEFFISWGFLAVVALGALSGAFFIPKSRKLVEIARRDIDASTPGTPVKWSDEYREISGQINKVAPISGLIVILTVYFMTAKVFL